MRFIRVVCSSACLLSHRWNLSLKLLTCSSFNSLARIFTASFTPSVMPINLRMFPISTWDKSMWSIMVELEGCGLQIASYSDRNSDNLIVLTTFYYQPLLSYSLICFVDGETVKGSTTFQFTVNAIQQYENLSAVIKRFAQTWSTPFLPETLF